MKIFAAPVSTKIPFGNYNRTVVQGVELFNQKWHVWGLKKSYLELWHTIQKDDIVFFYHKKYFISYARILEKQNNEKVATELWGSFTEYQKISTWPLLLFLSEPIDCKIPIQKINEIQNYKSRYFIRSFSKLNDRFIEYIESKYESIEDFIKSDFTI